MLATTATGRTASPRSELYQLSLEALLRVQVRPHGPIMDVLPGARIRSSGARSLVDVLELVPDLVVTRIATGLAVVVALEDGIPGPTPLLIMDGRPTRTLAGSVAVLLDVPADEIRRVEIHRAAGSSGNVAWIHIVMGSSREGGTDRPPEGAR